MCLSPLSQIKATSPLDVSSMYILHIQIHRIILWARLSCFYCSRNPTSYLSSSLIPSDCFHYLQPQVPYPKIEAGYLDSSVTRHQIPQYCSKTWTEVTTFQLQQSVLKWTLKQGAPDSWLHQHHQIDGTDHLFHGFEWSWESFHGTSTFVCFLQAKDKNGTVSCVASPPEP